MRNGLQKTEWVKIGFEISPLAERGKNALAFTVRSFH
jgi:hypothetical protein